MRTSELAMPKRIDRFSGLEALTEVKVIDEPSRFAWFWVHGRSVLRETGMLLRRGIYAGVVLTVAIVTAGAIVQGAALGIESLNGSRPSDSAITIPWRENRQFAAESVRGRVQPVKSADIVREEGRYQVNMARESNRTLQTVLSSLNRIASQIRR